MWESILLINIITRRGTPNLGMFLKGAEWLVYRNLGFSIFFLHKLKNQLQERNQNTTTSKEPAQTDG